MSINLQELLPEDISNETAYHIVNFLSELTLALESYYLSALRQYSENHPPFDDEVPF